MTPEYFGSGTDIETYIKEIKNYRSLVQGLAREASAKDADVEELKATLARYPGPVKASAFTESWCGDSASNLPILKSLFGKAGIAFRVFDMEHHGELKQHYHDDEVDHIPVVSLWDAGGAEIVRWIEAPAAVNPIKDAWKAKHPRMMELYGIKEGNKELENEFARLYRDFLEEMAVWYREGMWDETVREMVALAKAGR